jgi:hypothetical protein
MEGQAADGSDSLAHEAIIVFDVVDQLAVPVVDGSELVHGAAAGRRREGRTGKMGQRADDQGWVGRSTAS